jgi:hypothetical protein
MEMKRWVYVGLGIAVAIVLAQMPGPVGWAAFGSFGATSTWIISQYPWLLGLAMVLVPLPIAIAKYPLSHKLICQRTSAQSKLADCHVKLRHLSGWGDNRQNYIAITQAKVIPMPSVVLSEVESGNALNQLRCSYIPCF